MPWPYRHIVVVSAAEQAAANQLAAQIDPDDGSNTFGVPLSPNGLEPATHFGCSTASEAVMAQAMFDAQPVLLSVRWWRLEAATGELIDTNTAQGLPGQVWTWRDTLAAVGLTTVAGEEP